MLTPRSLKLGVLDVDADRVPEVYVFDFRKSIVI